VNLIQSCLFSLIRLSKIIDVNYQNPHEGREARRVHASEYGNLIRTLTKICAYSSAVLGLVCIKYIDTLECDVLLLLIIIMISKGKR
jgi:hypothetical protein